MKLAYSNIETKLNNGTGFLPVSTYITIENKFLEDITNIYDVIVSIGCRDIIFLGNIYASEEPLKWLTARLLSELYYVSISIILPQKIPEIVCRRMIVESDLNYLKKLSDKLTELREIDILVLNPNSIEELKQMRMIFLQTELKCQLMVKGSITEMELIEAGIFDIPLIGEINNDAI